MYSSNNTKDPTIMKYVNPEKIVSDKTASPYSETVCQKYFSCRWALAYLCFSGRLFQFTIRQCMSMAMVCITPDSQPYSQLTITDQNASLIKVATETNNRSGMEVSNETEKFTVDWDSGMKGMVLSSYFYGFMISTMVGGYLTGKVGYKIVIGIAMCTGAISTLITPFGIITNPYLVITLRTIVGLFQGIAIPGFRGIWGVWAPKHERTQLATVTYSGTDIGNIVAFGASGYLCNLSLMDGWPLIFYAFGSFNILWLLLWCICVFDSPETHPRISDQEKQIIQCNTNGNVKGKMLSPPWLKIMTSGPLWGILIAALCNSWGNIVLQVMLPQYMRDVLHFDITENGMLSMLPFFGRFFGHITLSYLADSILQRNISKTATVRKVFQCTGFIIPAAMIIGVGFLDHNNRMSAVVLLTLSITINSFSDVAFRVNHLDIAPRFASLIAGISLSFSQIPGIIVPYITSILTPNGTQQEWQHVFLNCAGIYVFGAIIFTIFGKGEEEEWSKDITETPDHTSNSVTSGKCSFISIDLNEEKENTKDIVCIADFLTEKEATTESTESDADSGCAVSNTGVESSDTDIKNTVSDCGS